MKLHIGQVSAPQSWMGHRVAYIYLLMCSFVKYLLRFPRIAEFPLLEFAWEFCNRAPDCLCAPSLYLDYLVGIFSYLEMASRLYWINNIGFVGHRKPRNPNMWKNGRDGQWEMIENAIRTIVLNKQMNRASSLCPSRGCFIPIHSKEKLLDSNKYLYEYSGANLFQTEVSPVQSVCNSYQPQTQRHRFPSPSEFVL